MGFNQVSSLLLKNTPTITIRVYIIYIKEMRALIIYCVFKGAKKPFKTKPTKVWAANTRLG